MPYRRRAQTVEGDEQGSGVADASAVIDVSDDAEVLGACTDYDASPGDAPATPSAAALGGRARPRLLEGHGVLAPRRLAPPVRRR